jgi:hypothetical protein
MWFDWKMLTTSKWPRWVGVFGASLFFGGIAWVAVWDYSHRTYPEFIKYELRLPWVPRPMVFVGFALLAFTGARIGIRFLRRFLSGRAGRNLI